MANKPEPRRTYADRYYTVSLTPLDREDGRREVQLCLHSGGVGCEVYMDANGARWLRGTLEAWAEWLEGAENE